MNVKCLFDLTGLQKYYILLLKAVNNSRFDFIFQYSMFIVLLLYIPASAIFPLVFKIQSYPPISIWCNGGVLSFECGGNDRL